MAAASELNVARKSLADALGDDIKLYLASMAMWFKQKITKEDFDIEARKLLNPDTVHLHNEFLLAILNKCQSLTSCHGKSVSKDTSNRHSVTGSKTPKKGKPKKKSRPARATFEHRFVSANPSLYIPQVVPKDLQDEDTPVFCTREYILPESFMIHGRMFIAAWEAGLDNVDDNAVRLLMIAVQHHIKEVLMAVIAQRHGYKLREKKFKYAIGTPVPHPYLRNSIGVSENYTESHATAISSQGSHIPSIKPTVEQGEDEAAMQLACASQEEPPFQPISMLDLFITLQVHKNAIPSHSVYAVNIERILSHLWHPSLDQLEQDNIHRQETILKNQLMSSFT